MEIGFVGKLNVGKFIFFLVVIFVDVDIVNYLFMMIDVNVGVIYVIVEYLCKEFGCMLNF